MSASFENESTENARIGSENARIGSENARIGALNPWETARNAWIDFVEKLHASGRMTAITTSAIITVLKDLSENQIIGTRDIQKILDCKDTKALRILNEMKEAKIIVAITGKGKGKYILNISEQGEL